MAVPVACVHLKMANAALPALLPTPPKWKMLPVLPSSCLAAVPPKPLGKPGRADVDERWDARKTKASAASSSSPRFAPVASCAGHGSSRKSATSPPPKPCRADSAARWDAHKKAAVPASSSSSSSSSGTPSVISSSKFSISHASSAEPQGDGEISSTGSNDMDDTEEEEEIVWKPRAMYAGPGFVGAVPEPSMLPMPTWFLVRVA